MLLVIDDLHTNQHYALTLTWSLSKLTVMRTDGPPIKIGVSSELRRSFKDKAVTCSTADGAAVLFRTQIRAAVNDGILDSFDVFDGTGIVIGLITRPFVGSGLGEYVIETAAGRWTLTEAWKNSPKSLLWTAAELVASFCLPVSRMDRSFRLREQFAIVNESGVQIGHASLAHKGIKVTYDISVGDDRLDMRVAAAIGVVTTLNTYPT